MRRPQTVVVFCVCPCHLGSIADYQRFGVDVTEVIEAAVACNSCRPAHAPALLAKGLPNDPEPPEPPEPAHGTWDGDEGG